MDGFCPFGELMFGWLAGWLTGWDGLLGIWLAISQLTK